MSATGRVSESKSQTQMEENGGGEWERLGQRREGNQGSHRPEVIDLRATLLGLGLKDRPKGDGVERRTIKEGEGGEKTERREEKERGVTDTTSEIATVGGRERKEK